MLDIQTQKSKKWNRRQNLLQSIAHNSLLDWKKRYHLELANTLAWTSNLSNQNSEVPSVSFIEQEKKRGTMNLEKSCEAPPLKRSKPNPNVPWILCLHAWISFPGIECPPRWSELHASMRTTHCYIYHYREFIVGGLEYIYNSWANIWENIGNYWEI